MGSDVPCSVAWNILGRILDDEVHEHGDEIAWCRRWISCPVEGELLDRDNAFIGLRLAVVLHPKRL